MTKESRANRDSKCVGLVSMNRYEMSCAFTVEVSLENSKGAPHEECPPHPETPTLFSNLEQLHLRPSLDKCIGRISLVTSAFIVSANSMHTMAGE